MILVFALSCLVGWTHSGGRPWPAELSPPSWCACPVTGIGSGTTETPSLKVGHVPGRSQERLGGGVVSTSTGLRNVTGPASAACLLPVGDGVLSVTISTEIGLSAIDTSTLTLHHAARTWHWQFSGAPIPAPRTGHVARWMGADGVQVAWAGPLDVSCDGFIDGIDADLFSNWFASGDPRADYSADGFVDGIDSDLWDNDWNDAHRNGFRPSAPVVGRVAAPKEGE